MTTTREQWCRHARDEQVRHSPTLWWCSRCGSLWAGEVWESHGRRRWRPPLITRRTRLPSTPKEEHHGP